MVPDVLEYAVIQELGIMSQWRFTQCGIFLVYFLEFKSQRSE